MGVLINWIGLGFYPYVRTNIIWVHTKNNPVWIKILFKGKTQKEEVFAFLFLYEFNQKKVGSIACKDLVFDLCVKTCVI
jgi:hypothetical protein